MLLRNYLLMEALYAEGTRTTKFIEGFNQVICEGPGTWLAGCMVRAVSSNSLFNAMAASCRCIGNCTSVEQKKDVGLGIFKKTSDAFPFKSGRIFARIAMILLA